MLLYHAPLGKHFYIKYNKTNETSILLNIHMFTESTTFFFSSWSFFTRKIKGSPVADCWEGPLRLHI